jgi:predicted nucleotidyltransferase
VNVNPEVVMNDLNLNHVIIERFKPFQDEILSGYKDNIHSITLTGSALTDDFVPGKSDINSVVVLMEMDLKFLELLATLGR